MVKKSAINDLPGPSANVFTLVKVNEGDRLGWLHLTNGRKELLLVTALGMAIRFNEEEVRPMGLVAAGVMGLKLQPKDEVAGMEILPQPGEVFMVASDGSAKRVAVAQFPRQGRYGQGVVAWKLPGKARVIGVAVGKGTARLTLHLSKLAPKMVRLDEAPLQGRAARGARIQELKAGEQVLRLTVPWDVGRPVAEAKPGVARRVRRTKEEAAAAKSAKPATRKRIPGKVGETMAEPVKPRSKKPSTRSGTAKPAPARRSKRTSGQ